MWQVFVTGWNDHDESVEGEGYGDNEDAAIHDAMGRWGITEIGDVTDSHFVSEANASWLPKALYLRNGSRKPAV